MATAPQRRAEIAESEIVRIYPYRADVPDDLWARLFENAIDNIGILVYSGLLPRRAARPQDELLKKKADDGASIRILLGDPDCPQVALQGQEEDIGDAIAAKIRNVLLAYYAPYAESPGHQDQAALHHAVQLDLLVRRRHARQHPRLRGTRAFRPGPAPAAPQLRDLVPDLRPQLRPRMGPDPQDLDRPGGDQAMGERIDYLDDPDAPQANSVVPSANVIVVNDQGEILMIRRTDNDNWAVPGGGMDLGRVDHRRQQYARPRKRPG